VFQEARRRDFSLAKEEARGAATGLLLPYFASGWGNGRGETACLVGGQIRHHPLNLKAPQEPPPNVLDPPTSLNYAPMLSDRRGPQLCPHVDVRETDKEIVVEAELPGIDEKDISLALQDGVLTIRGEKKHEHDEEKENYRVMERRYGSFQRSLRLPDTVDQDKVEASFDNGVLKIKVAKRPADGW
jgi:HSP20 family molecular chaperone IbpA